jgi:hypothetical protein
MASYKITQGLNTLRIELEGKFGPEIGDKYLTEFNAVVRKIQPANTDLIFKAADFQVLGSDLQDSLKQCFELYHKIGFKKISMDLGSNVILSMQVKRLAAAAGLTNFEII